MSVSFLICDPFLPSASILNPRKDKTTISYAVVMGLRKDIHLVGQDYSNVAMMFYIGFLAAEFPTQYLAQRISRLGKYLGVNVRLWRDWI